jgi:hypothetical protein
VRGAIQAATLRDASCSATSPEAAISRSRRASSWPVSRVKSSSAAALSLVAMNIGSTSETFFSAWVISAAQASTGCRVWVVEVVSIPKD